MFNFICDLGYCILYILGFEKNEADFVEEDAKKYCSRDLL